MTKFQRHNPNSPWDVSPAENPPHDHSSILDQNSRHGIFTLMTDCQMHPSTASFGQRNGRRSSQHHLRRSARRRNYTDFVVWNMRDSPTKRLQKGLLRRPASGYRSGQDQPITPGKIITLSTCEAPGQEAVTVPRKQFSHPPNRNNVSANTHNTQ